MDDVFRVIMSSPTKSCSLDPIPTSLLKSVAVALTPIITSIANASFQSGIFPQKYKHGMVTPLLKKPNLDKEVLSNYRPVTQLSFVSKILERLVSIQLDEHLSKHHLLSPSQSAYRSGHSTETALLALQNDILQSAGRGRGTIVVLFDLTAAFDTIEQEDS